MSGVIFCMDLAALVLCYQGPRANIPQGGSRTRLVRVLILGTIMDRLQIMWRKKAYMYHTTTIKK